MIAFGQLCYEVSFLEFASHAYVSIFGILEETNLFSLGLPSFRFNPPDDECMPPRPTFGTALVVSAVFRFGADFAKISSSSFW